ncbi:MAG TPA: TonB-dependent receptor plug domain-containing protein [Flavisolibacter sp.]|nr:TonB-dependent receptor plug domain-containing protein [Flavisolibacter sp.]
MKPIALCLFVSIITNYTFAQEKNSELDPVTITTSINPEKASRTGRDLVVIKGERFANLPVHSVDELLRYLPGIEIQSRGPLGSQSDIVIRGGTFQQVLVILDGLRLNDPNSGHFTSYFPIAPSEIDHIEILKGAASAIYGSEAVGGVVHIITKTFAAKSSDKKKLNAIAQITGGEYNFLNLNVGGFYDNGTTSVAAGLLTNTTTGQAQRGTRGFIHNNTASFSFNHHLSEKWEVKFRTAYDDRDFAAQNFYTPFVSDTAKEQVTTTWNQLALIHSGLKDRISLLVGFKELSDEYKFNSGLTPNKNNSKLTQALLTDEWKLKEKTIITSGLQFINKKITSNDRGNHIINQAAAFVVLNQSIGSYFFLSPAARLDYSDGYGWEFDPQINLSFKKHNLQLRGSAGRTIRDADFTERYNNYNKTFVSSGSIGNPELNAEHSFSYEVGADYFLLNDLKLSATYFKRNQKNAIDYVPTSYADMPRKSNLSPAGSYQLARNISELSTKGFETEIQYSKQLKNQQQVWASIGLTWLNDKSSSSTPTFYISSHAKFLTTFNAVYSSNFFTVSVNGLYKKRSPRTSTADIAKISTDYFVLNGKIETNVIRKLLSVFVEADNIFDRKYADLLGPQMSGRWLMGGIKISLSK